jgi:hypothetical protein
VTVGDWIVNPPANVNATLKNPCKTIGIVAYSIRCGMYAAIVNNVEPNLDSVIYACGTSSDKVICKLTNGPATPVVGLTVVIVNCVIL